MEKQNDAEQEQRRMEQMIMDMQLPIKKKEKDKATKLDWNLTQIVMLLL